MTKIPVSGASGISAEEHRMKGILGIRAGKLNDFFKPRLANAVVLVPAVFTIRYCRSYRLDASGDGALTIAIPIEIYFFLRAINSSIRLIKNELNNECAKILCRRSSRPLNF